MRPNNSPKRNFQHGGKANVDQDRKWLTFGDWGAVIESTLDDCWIVECAEDAFGNLRGCDAPGSTAEFCSVVLSRRSLRVSKMRGATAAAMMPSTRSVATKSSSDNLYLGLFRPPDRVVVFLFAVVIPAPAFPKT